jgi:hypothetical protein
VELHHLRVFERNANIHAGYDAITSRAVRIRRCESSKPGQ